MGFASTLESLAGWVWSASWHAAILVVVIGAAQCLSRRQLSPAWAHALWLIVVARLLMPPSLPESPASIMNLARVGLFEESSPSERVIETTPVYGEFGSNVRTNPTRPAIAEPGGLSGSHDPASRSALSAGQFAADANNWRDERAAINVLWRALPWIWLMGCLVFGARLAIGIAQLAARVRRAKVVSSSKAREVFEECRREMGARTRLDLLESPEVESPALCGLLRKKLLLPMGLAEDFTRRELRHIFLHELGHLRRRDVELNWLMLILGTLHWFNPLVAWAFRRMRAERELACDALALSLARDGENSRYGETIVKLLNGFQRSGPVLGTVGILEDNQPIRHRITMIAEFKSTHRRSSTFGLAILTIFAVIGLTDARTPDGAAVRDAHDPPDEAAAESAFQEGAEGAGSSKPDEDLGVIAGQAPGRGEGETTGETGVIGAEEPPTGKDTTTRKVYEGAGRELLIKRLNETILDEVVYEGASLGDVVRDLQQRSRVNFLLNPFPMDSKPAPESGESAESNPKTVDVFEVPIHDAPIRIHPPLRNVRLIDVIQAIIAVAEVPLDYAVEDYALIIKPARGDRPKLITRTFRLDPTTLTDWLDTIDPGWREEPTARAEPRQPVDRSKNSLTRVTPLSKRAQVLRDIFTSAGVDFSEPASESRADPRLPVPHAYRKVLFFNERTGVLFVRATEHDLEIIEHVVKALNTPRPQEATKIPVIKIDRADEKGAPPGSD